MMIAKRILLAVAATVAVAAVAISIGVGGHIMPAWAQDMLPPAAPAPPTLGNPTNLTATTGGRGEVQVSFSPAAGATVHWVWRVRYDNTDGVWVKGSASGLQTVTGLEPSQGYYFIVIAGRPQAAGGGMQWSSWSNWGAAAAGTATGNISTFPANPVNGDYDFDNDGLIEIRSITQLDAIRHDLDGNGVADANSDDDDVNAATAATYAAAFPNAATGMGCPDAGCAGYELAASLDFQTGDDSGAWVPVEGYAADFDGNGLTISNLFIYSAFNRVGLFGWTTSGSTVRRVGLEAVNVIGNDDTGGLVGHNGGDIIDSYVKGSVSGDDVVGGLVGNNAGAVTKSYANATVHGRFGDRNFIGGLVGFNPGHINSSYAEGAVSGDDNIGGLVGRNNGVIAASYATAIVSGDYSVGGLVGHNNAGSIAAAYATGAAAGHRYVGGLVGYNNAGSITAAYATGTVSRYNDGGGLVGYQLGRKTHHSYWDTETSYLTSRATTNAGFGRTTAQLQTPTSNTGIYAQWDPAQWDFGTSSQYPVLKVEGLSVSAQRGGEATAAQPGAGNTAPADDDRAALVAFYQATGGASWTNNDNWLSEQPVGQWHGVTTDADGRVTALELDANGLSGSLPAELSSLEQLTVLRMGSNQLTGPIPPALGSLSNLSILGLGNNRLTGSIPSELGSLSSLTRVSLWNNQLSGPIPSELGNLSGLTKLSLGSNQLAGAIPSSLGNLSSLESLGLQRNEISGPIPASLGNLSNLTWLDFDFNQLSGSIPPQLGSLSNLTVLRLGSNQLTGTVPPELGRLSSLSILGLGNNRLTGSIPPQLGSLASLTRVSLWNNDLTGPIPAELGNLSHLTKLSLGSNQLSGAIPSTLGNLANLNDLALQSNNLSGPIPASLGSLGNLTHLRLYGNELTGAIPAELGSLTKLNRLYLQGNQLSGAIPAELGRLSNLDVLNLSNNQLTGEIPSALGASGGTARAGSPGDGLMTGYDAVERGGALPAIEIGYAGPGGWSYGQMPEQVGSLARLRVLNLSYNRLSGNIPPTLGSLLRLKRLYLHYNNLIGRVLASLERRLETQRVDRENEAEECGANSTAEGVQNDRRTLLYLYSLTDDRGYLSVPSLELISWEYHDGWEEAFADDADTPLEDWSGVTVNGHGRVTHLNLGHNGLKLDGNILTPPDIAKWRDNLAELNESATTKSVNDPLYCLQALDFSNDEDEPELYKNELEGNIGAVLAELNPHGEVELRFKGNEFENWLDDDPESVTLEDATSELVDALEITIDSELKPDQVADIGMQVLRETAKSKVAGFLAKSGGRVTLVGSLISNDHKEVTEAIVHQLVGGGKSGCYSFLSNFSFRNPEQVCETGFFSGVVKVSSYNLNQCWSPELASSCCRTAFGCSN